MARLDGRVAIVTGAAQGIGKTYAMALAEEGAAVVIADMLDGSEVADEITATYQGAKALNIPTDVSHETSAQEMVGKTVDAFGKLDILVNNAALFGNLEHSPFEQISVDSWDQVMAVNVRGPFLCAKAAVPEMRKQGYGKIINIASGTLFKGSPTFLHYVTSKGAVLAMTRSLSREVGDDGICVNTLAPGLTMSENVLAREPETMSASRQATVNSRAFKRDQEPGDLVGGLLFLASSDSDFMTGQCIVVDGGSVNH